MSPRAIRILSALLLLPALDAAGQDRLDTHTVDAGGGTSAGAGWRLSGTLGQPDAAPLSSCSADGGPACVLPAWELEGGFWPGLATIPATPSPACGTRPACLFRDGFGD